MNVLEQGENAFICTQVCTVAFQPAAHRVFTFERLGRLLSPPLSDEPMAIASPKFPRRARSLPRRGVHVLVFETDYYSYERLILTSVFAVDEHYGLTTADKCWESSVQVPRTAMDLPRANQYAVWSRVPFLYIILCACPPGPRSSGQLSVIPHLSNSCIQS